MKNFNMNKKNSDQNHYDKKSSDQKFQCYLVGGSSLLIRCARIIQESGHIILGIFSSDENVKNWALQQAIDCTDQWPQFEEKLNANSFDYLFSIVNPDILPKRILETAKQLAINYHDAPLPKYAGTHATTWALMNEETTHGITWHIAADHVDGGHILKQATFQIEPNETTLSLNLKCYEHAATAFSALIQELATKTITPIPQNLANRTFFKASKKPPLLGFMNWNLDAQQLLTVYRALHFGDYPNAVASPKFIFGDQLIIPKYATIIQSSSEKTPGTIIQVNKQSLDVSTHFDTLRLTHCLDIVGQPVDLNIITAQLQTHNRLELPNESYLQTVEAMMQTCAPHEAFWVKQFTQAMPCQIPVMVDTTPYNSSTASTTVPLSIPITHAHASYVPPLTALLVYLYRMNTHQNFNIYFSHPKLKHYTELNYLFFAPFVPLFTQFTETTNFDDAMTLTAEVLSQLAHHHTYALDIFYRYPQIKHRHKMHWAIAIVEDLEHYQPVTFAAVTVAIDATGATFKVFTQPEQPHVHALDAQQLSHKITQHLHCLITGVATHPTQSISLLPILTVQEKSQVIEQWSQNSATFPTPQTITEVIEAQVLRHPNQIAVFSAEHTLTYQALNEKANQLAHYLQSLNLNAESLVAIYLDRHVDIIVSILAILKAGAAYMPIDVNHPKAYVQSIFLSAAFVITHEHYMPFITSCLPEKPNSQIIALDVKPALFDNYPTSTPERTTHANSLAYVMHTSGSTGTPKGVLVEHRNVINFAYSQIQQCNITQNSCMLGFSAFSFDASVFEIFCTLFAGAKLYIAKKEEIIPGDPLMQTFRKKEISVALITPVALEMTDAVPLPHLKTLISAGDACSATINEKWNKDGLLFLNGYGPTETTVFATVEVCSQDGSAPPIGKPIHNAIVYILDNYMQPVPVGVLGELYIGGAGLSRGYLNQPNLTKERFLPNPFIKSPTDPNNRLYKTGDLARWLPNGKIEYKGRIDAQVKIRGYRIELSSIEAIIQQFPSVQQTVATTLIDSKNQRYILAYVVPREKTKIDLRELRAYLADRLPTYMIPQSFMVLDQLPINVNGKVDKKALPIPTERLRLINSSTYTPPITEVEKQLANLWCQLLNLETVGIHDNFFNLGGHSLLVTEVLLNVKKLFTLNISLKTFFDNPTIYQLAKLINHGTAEHEPEKPHHFSIVKDAILSLEPPHSLSTPSTPGAILLTGATGFLGTHLLRDLHRYTDKKIYCLIRAKSYSEAFIRNNKNIITYGFRELLNSPRIFFLLGDFTQKNLGLSEEVFQLLTEEIDLIYHNGALVNHICHYDTLKASNIDSTLEIIRLAAIGRCKKIHYLSALNASVENKMGKPMIVEEFASENSLPLDLHNGYCQTKWISERMLEQAKEQGFRINIYRPSWITGQYETGIWEPNTNHLFNFIKSCIQIGYAPDQALSLEMWPVDVLSKAIVKLSLVSPEESKVYNFTNPRTLGWPAWIDWLKAYGYPLQLVSVPTWRNHCFKYMTPENALYPFASLYLKDSDWLSGLSASKVPTVESHKTAAALQSIEMDYPMINAGTLRVYFDYLQKIQFISPGLLKSLTAVAV